MIKNKGKKWECFKSSLQMCVNDYQLHVIIAQSLVDRRQGADIY